MGLSDGSGWRTLDRLPEVPASEPPLEDLEARALANRLDLAALRQEVETLSAALRLAETSRWTGVVDIGADVARLRDGSVVVGPRLSIELPVFDQRQGPIARLEAQLRASRGLLAARMVDVRSEVREARGRLLYAREAVERYRREIVPARERVVALSQEQYSAMLLGVFQLVEAKQSELGAYRAYIDSVRDYWVARAELEHAVGARVPVVTEARNP
jgi:cobalt-zinc-cadmium efflux system outer membrane protein